MAKVAFKRDGVVSSGVEPQPEADLPASGGEQYEASGQSRFRARLIVLMIFLVLAATGIGVIAYLPWDGHSSRYSTNEDELGQAGDRSRPPTIAPQSEDWPEGEDWLSEARKAWAAKDWKEAEQKIALVLESGADASVLTEARQLADEIAAYKKAATGWISLEVTPEAAVCFLDSEEVEETGRIKVQGIGEHALTVLAPRYESRTITVNLKEPGEEIALSPVLLAPSPELMMENERMRKEAEEEAGRLRQAVLEAEQARTELERKLAATERQHRNADQDRPRPAAVSRPAGNSAQSGSGDLWRVVYGGVGGVSVRATPGGEDVLATAYKQDAVGIRGLARDPVNRDGLRWVRVELQGWMARRMIGREYSYLDQLSNREAVVTWDGGADPDDNFISLKPNPALKGARIAKVYTGSKVSTGASAVADGYEWVEAGLVGWMATTSPKGTPLISEVTQ